MPLSCLPRSFPGFRRETLAFTRIVPFVVLLNERCVLHHLSNWITYQLFSRVYMKNYTIFTFCYDYSYYILIIFVCVNKVLTVGEAFSFECNKKKMIHRWNIRLIHVLEVQWTGARLIAVLSLLGQQQQFHAFAFASQRGGPFFASPLVDPLQPLPNPLQPLPNPLQPRDPLSSFRHAMPGNCQSK